MKALCLTTPDGKSVNAVDSTIVISNKEGNLRLSPAKDIIDYRKRDEIRKRMLEHYIKLKKELTEAGLLTDKEIL